MDLSPPVNQTPYPLRNTRTLGLSSFKNQLTPQPLEEKSAKTAKRKRTVGKTQVKKREGMSEKISELTLPQKYMDHSLSYHQIKLVQGLWAKVENTSPMRWVELLFQLLTE